MTHANPIWILDVGHVPFEDAIINCNESKKGINPLGANPTKWSNTLKQFIGKSLQNIWVYLIILWGWRLKGYLLLVKVWLTGCGSILKYNVQVCKTTLDIKKSCNDKEVFKAYMKVKRLKMNKIKKTLQNIDLNYFFNVACSRGNIHLLRKLRL